MIKEFATEIIAEPTINECIRVLTALHVDVKYKYYGVDALRPTPSIVLVDGRRFGTNPSGQLAAKTYIKHLYEKALKVISKIKIETENYLSISEFLDNIK